MNRNLYRIILNKARGMLMVVGELATSAHGTASPASGSGQFPHRRISALTRLQFALLVSLGFVTLSSGATIMADGQAPGNQQPTIIGSANGTPQINIQTPGSGGVSRNVYSQFDVDKKGVVLNNSHANTQTQLAGMVTGNPWLAKGEAKIILNEVNSRNASQLNGFIEVAGQKAQVVIANPSGITCNGCGFINAHRATLTTGQPQMNNGQLTGYDVDRGEIVIQGAGLDSSQQDSTDLIARAVKVNAGIWANELNVTTGRNTVDAAHQAVTVKSTDGSVRPRLAVDVAQLGGMYANKIRLKGTESGVGVHNAGSIGASAGDVVVNADGTLTNTGSIKASENLQLIAQEAVNNQGQLYAAGNTDVSAKNGLFNTGQIAAAQHTTLSAASISSSSESALAAGMAANGTLSGAGNLTLNSRGELKANGQNLAANQLNVQATAIDLSGSQTSGDTIKLSASNGDISTAGAHVSATHQLTANTGKLLNNDGGKIAAEQLTLTSHALSNQQGVLQQLGEQDLQLSQAGGINNRQGTIASNSKNLELDAASLNNEQGKIVHAGDGRLDIASGQITGSEGTLVSNGALSLNGTALDLDGATTQAASISLNADSLSHRSGQLLQTGEGTLLLNVDNLLENQDGLIASAGAVSLSASDLDNQQGRILTTGEGGLQLALDNTLNNRNGSIAAGGDVTSLSNAVDNTGGLLQSGNALNLNTRGARLVNQNSGDQGGIISTGKMTLTTGDLDNRNGQIAAGSLKINSTDIANQNGTLTTQSTLQLNSGEVNNQQGVIFSDGDMNIISAGFDNSQSGTLASKGAVELTASALNNQQGVVQALGDIVVTAAQSTLDNAAGLIHSALNVTLNAGKIINQNTRADGLGIQGNSVTFNAADVDNSNGALLANEGLELTLSGELNNTTGLLSSQNSLNADAQKISNRDGDIEAGKLIALTSDSLSGDGKLLSLGDMTLNLTQDLLNTGSIQASNNLTLTTAGNLSNQTLIQAGNTLTVSANNIFNNTSGEFSAGTTQLTASSALTNYGLIDGFNTRINGQTVTNIGSGRIYGDALAIHAGTLNNLADKGQAATIAARQRLDMGAGTINNRDHALIYSDGDLATGGGLTSDYRATGQAGMLNNHSATIESAGNMALNISTLNNINDNFSLENVLVSKEDISEYEVSRLNNGVRYNDKDYTIYIYQDEVNILCIEGVICGTTNGDRFTHYAYTRTITEDRVKESDPGKIIAGGNLSINAASVLNDKSQIIAGGMLNMQAGSVDNVEVEAYRQIADSGTATAYSRHQSKGGDSSRVKTTDYLPPAVIQAIDLKASTLEENTRGQTSNPGVADYQNAGVNGQIQGAGNADTLHIVPPAGKTFEVKMSGNESVVRIAGPNTRLPDNSLFRTNPSSTSPYLVETDPRFTNQKNWLGSDYMMNAFTTNTDNVLKRLGDGYYEQKLIREQVIALTGQRYLSGQQNDEDQYKMLMNNGIEFGQQYGLTLGVALTQQQMALLTGDIVWMVTQTVQLADGTTQQVLVPQVYAVVKDGDLDGSGALLAGKNISLALSGDLTNSGRISGQQNTQLLADNINNIGGQILGTDVLLRAQTDINNIGGLIAGNNSLLASAGRDINATTTTRSAESADGNFVRNTIDRVAGFYVEQPDGKLALQTGRDINLQAARVVNSGEGGTTALSAGRDLNLTTVTTASRDNLNWGDDWLHQSATQQVGSEVIGNGNVAMSARHDVNVTAGSVSAGQQLNVLAGNDINIQHATDTETFDQHYKATGSSSIGSKTTVESRDTFSHQTINSSQLDGDSVSMQAGYNLNVTGSNVVGTHDVSLAAGNDLNIVAATSQNEESHSYSEKKSGISGTGGIGVTVGTSSLKTTDEALSLSSTGSTVGSSQGNLTLSAGNSLTVKGSDVLAAKDLSLTGKEVAILAAENQSSQRHTVEQKQSGLTLALSGTVGSVINSAVTTATEASNESNDRLAALKGVKAALTGVQAWQGSELADAGSSEGSVIGVNLSYGSQSSKSTQTATQTQNQGSTLTAGNNLTIAATGTDINVQGSQLQAGNNASLSAARDVNLISAQDSHTLEGKNESHGSSVGVGINFGQGVNGLSLNASVNKGKGSETGNGVSHTETTVNAGNNLSVISGRDTTLTGAQVSGEKVTLDVGRNLTLTSEQDSDYYDSKQQNVSAGGSVSMGGGGGSVNLSRDKMHSSFETVQEQSGIFAGAGGFDVTVGGHTQLNGAVIGSTATADKNKLDTGTLGFRDIKNSAEYEVEHQSVGMSTGGGVADGGVLGNIGNQLVSNLASGLLVGVNGSGSDSSTTKSAVSEGTITVRDKDKQKQNVDGLSRDVEHANQTLSPIFDKEKEQRRLQEAQLIAGIGMQVADIARTQGDINGLKAAKEKLGPLKENATGEERAAYMDMLRNSDEYKAEMQKLGTGSALQQGIQAATAAVQGLAGGDIAKAIAGGSAPYLAEVIHNMTSDPKTGKVNTEANLMAHAVLGAVVAQAQGNSALAGASGAAMGEYIAQQMYPGIKREDLTETQRQTISALATLAAGLASGVVGDSTADAMAGAQAGKNAVENNYLSVKEAEKKAVLERKEKTGTITPDEKNELATINQTDKIRDQAINVVCTNGNMGSSGCGALVGPAQEALKKYGENVTYSLLYKDLYPQDAKNLESVLQGMDAGSIGRDQAITAIAQASGVSWETAASRYDTAMQAQAMTAALAGISGLKSVTEKPVGSGTTKPSQSIAGRAPESNRIAADEEASGWSQYDKYRNGNGDWNWPAKLGFAEEPVKATLPVGTRLDRYGKTNGSFLAPQGTPQEQRALAPGSLADQYHAYEVIKPLPVMQGKIAPAFGEPGGGVQILPNMQERVDVQWLLDNKYIRKVN